MTLTLRSTTIIWRRRTRGHKRGCGRLIARVRVARRRAVGPALNKLSSLLWLVRQIGLLRKSIGMVVRLVVKSAENAQSKRGVTVRDLLDTDMVIGCKPVGHAPVT